MSTTYPIKDKLILEQFKAYYYKKSSFRNYALIILGLNTALRISDLLALKWKDVYDFEQAAFLKHLCLKEQKTGKDSMVALNPAVTAALSFLLKNTASSSEDYIFYSSRSCTMPLSRYQAYRIVKKAAECSGMTDHVSCHSLRKTFGYFAWKQGVPPAMLMNIYNHSSYQITRRYLCIEQDDRDDVFMKINL